MDITITIPKNENWSDEDVPRFQEIIKALVQSGGLSGVKGGKTILHFDEQGTFKAVQLDYYPYRRRSI